LPSRRGVQNRYYNAFQIPQDIVIRESKHLVSLRCEPGIAALIVLLARLKIMCLAIDFDNQLG
jgi:hypothetical protein